MTEVQVTQLLDRLTLEEKAGLCSGRDFWHLKGVEEQGLPSIMVTDGPHGLRKQKGASDHVGLMNSVPATCFPSASGLASSWNRELLHAVGTALARECRKEQVSVLLGPGINIKRHPLGGRNFEYFSEDPYLAGELAIAWVRGLQDQGVGASLKHYAVNNHESGRMVVDVVIDDRTLREIYLPAFEKTVGESQPWTVMCAYNKVNGVYLSEHRQFLTTILREEWGYEGLVLSDWGAVNDRVAGLKAGLDLEMPSSAEVNTRRILAALEDGSLSKSELDIPVRRVLSLIAKTTALPPEAAPCSLDEHHALARTAAEEACVLLKNDAALLPLKAQGKIAVIGALATHTRYQGSGSSQINPTRLEQPLDEISALAGQGAVVRYAPGYPLSGDSSPAMVDDALSLALDSDVVVIIAGLTPEYESEGFDRKHMRLPQAQLELVLALAKKVGDRMVIALQNGAPVELPFADGVAAILECYLGGQAGGSALARLLFGHANPGGKLAETFPLDAQDIPGSQWFPGELRQSQYREGIWVGYRYFCTTGIPVRYPFGHGLSYTRFDYADLRVRGNETTNSYRMEEGDEITVEFTVTNAGERDGAEVVQLYVGQQNSRVHRPQQELKGFSKVFLKAGESTTVCLGLGYRAFAYWSVSASRWVVESDSFVIRIGASAADIRLTHTVTLDTGDAVAPAKDGLEPYSSPGALAFDDASFAALLGHAIPPSVPAWPFHLNSTLAEVSSTWLGRKLHGIVKGQVSVTVGKDMDESGRLMLEAIISEMPLRNLVTQSQGKLSPRMMRAMIHIMNGNWGRLLRNAPVKAL